MSAPPRPPEEWCECCGDGTHGPPGSCDSLRCRPQASRVVERELCTSKYHGRVERCPECGMGRSAPAPTPTAQAPKAPATAPRAAPAPAVPQALPEPLEVIILDTETTGLGKDARIIEIACALVHLPTGRVGKVAQTLTHPGLDPYTGKPVPIHWGATKVHGLRDRDVAGAAPIEDVLGKLFAWAKGRPLAMHNAAFDRDRIREALSRAGVPWPGLPVYCTLKAARAALPGLPSYKLGALAQHLGVEAGRAHRAGGDVETTAGVLLALLARAGKGLAAVHGEADKL